MTRSGTMLGDVVGLGKTLTAIAVALMLRDEHGYMPLVVCPKNLVQMWEDHFEAYEVHGRVVSYSMAHAILPELRRYALVIIDESHTLRNDARRDYIAIRDYITANDSKVLLLTATPYNIRFRDVANQLALYIGDDDDLGISPTNALASDPRLADRVDGKTSTLAAFRRSEDPDDWKRLMSEHLVRRTRTFIKNNYARLDGDGRPFLEFADGRRFRFPQRIPRPIEHSFGHSDPAAIMSSDATLDVLSALRLPRYNLSRYRSGTTVLSLKRSGSSRTSYAGEVTSPALSEPRSTSVCHPADTPSSCRYGDTSPEMSFSATHSRTAFRFPPGQLSMPTSRKTTTPRPTNWMQPSASQTTQPRGTSLYALRTHRR
jgi:hypothetical protein